MAIWPSKKSKTSHERRISLDEFLGEDDGREASPLDFVRDSEAWQKRLAATTGQRAEKTEAQRALQLTAFSLIRGGDLFERSGSKKHEATDADLLRKYSDERLRPVANQLSPELMDTAIAGVCRVLAGNPAICLRMILAKPIDVLLIPQGRDFRSFGFPPNTNPAAAGIFYNKQSAARAMIGLREEYILKKPWLMIHEMTHAVHLMGMTAAERKIIDDSLLPVYRSRRWVEEVVAIYAERAFGAEYTASELASSDLYSKTRREWTDRSVFSLFVSELFRPR